jgi:hypothetical protein
MTTDALEAVFRACCFMIDGTYLHAQHQSPFSNTYTMIMGFNRQLPLFIVFAGAIFLVQRKLSLNLQTVLLNHESSSAYLHQDDDEKHTQQQPQQPPLDSAVPQKQEERRNITSITVPPASEYPTNDNESVPRSSNEQIRTPAHQSDTTTLQNNNRKNATKKSPNVLYTVFAGRKNRMLLQEPYWAEMHRLGQIDKVHLWNYTLHNRFTTENLQYLRHVERKYPFVTIMEPSLVEMPETLWFDSNHSLKDNVIANYGNGRATFRWPGVRWYTEYYRYYSVNPYDGVIIKADDDIVYVNSSMVRPFAEYLWNHANVFLLSASVVNQGLCAHYQQVHGAIPTELMELPLPGNGMGDLHDNATNALKLHLYFLNTLPNFSFRNRNIIHLTIPLMSTLLPFGGGIFTTRFNSFKKCCMRKDDITMKGPLRGMPYGNESTKREFTCLLWWRTRRLELKTK